MADIELVIKIDEGIAKGIIDGENDTPRHIVQGFQSTIADAIKNGTPLPKGHGALKDVDNIKTAFPSGEYVRTESVRATIDHEDTIIEADKEESEG